MDHLELPFQVPVPLESLTLASNTSAQAKAAIAFNQKLVFRIGLPACRIYDF